MNRPIFKNKILALVLLAILLFTGCHLNIETVSEHDERISSEIASMSETESIDSSSVLVSLYINTKSIDASDAGMLSFEDITVPMDSSVFDVLLYICQLHDIPLTYTGNTTSAYVSSINDISEKAYGAFSGWLYKVNDVSPAMGCGNYLVSKGDKIEFYYVTKYEG